MQVLRQVDPRADFPFASFDYVQGGRLAARHLLDRGARRVAFVGGLAGRPITLERMAGYLEVMAAAGLPPWAIHAAPSRAMGRDLALQLCAEDSDLDAALCFNDLVALGMQAGFAEAGRRVGRDFRLVGFDDIEEAGQGWPKLTSVRCNVAEFGSGVAGAMLGWLAGGAAPAAVTRADVALMVRDSSGDPG